MAAPYAMAGYLGLLQVSRASLLASAHHLQLPAAPLPIPHAALAAAAASASAGCLLPPLLSARRPRPRLQGARARWPGVA
jgi:hypothetical protein